MSVAPVGAVLARWTVLTHRRLLSEVPLDCAFRSARRPYALDARTGTPQSAPAGSGRARASRRGARSPRGRRSPCRSRRTRRDPRTSPRATSPTRRVRPSPRSSRTSRSSATPSGSPSKVNVCTMSSLRTHLVEGAVEAEPRSRRGSSRSGTSRRYGSRSARSSWRGRAVRSIARGARGRRAPGTPARVARRTLG